MAEQHMTFSLSRSFDDDFSNQHTPYFPGSGGEGSSFYWQPPPSTIPPPPHHQVAPPPSSKPRGRPPGSKNKPKPPLVITQTNEQDMKPVVIHVDPGVDVMEAIINYAHNYNAGIMVLSGSGSISNLTLSHSVSYSPSSSFTLHGPFTLFAFSGACISFPNSPLDGASNSSSNPNMYTSSSFSISFTSAQGKMYGGIVGGKVVSSNDVQVVVSLLKNPDFHRVPGINEND
ncbi:PPC domain, partial [Sesbania bispinosa]